MSKIRDKRKELNMTQHQLAVKVGTTQNTIWRIEKGKLKPSLALIKKIATELNCTIDSLL